MEETKDESVELKMKGDEGEDGGDAAGRYTHARRRENVRDRDQREIRSDDKNKRKCIYNKQQERERGWEEGNTRKRRGDMRSN